MIIYKYKLYEYMRNIFREIIYKTLARRILDNTSTPYNNTNIL